MTDPEAGRNPALDEAALYDLIFCLEEDSASGALLPVDDYIARFPDLETAVRREYTRVTTGVDPDEGGSEHGTHVGPYRLVRELGHGGQGAVYLAEDERIGRNVALKVLSSFLGSIPAHRLERFRREARVVAKLDHPAICGIYEAELDAETPYIAMRHVEGSTLAHEIRARSEGREATLPCRPNDGPELDRVLVWFEATARALHAAHEAGVVHRDVKPGNVMVTGDGAPVVLDFGIARARGEDLQTLTRSGEVFGTPLYMPPEQLLGDTDEVDRRADVYALGATLFEALTLRTPFRADNQPALQLAILHEPVPDPARLNPALPASLFAVMQTALDKDPSRRYASAAEFADDLSRVRKNGTVLARGPGAWLRTRRWAQRRPMVAASLVTAILVLAIASVPLLQQMSKAESAINEAAAARTDKQTALDDRQAALDAAALALGDKQIEDLYRRAWRRKQKTESKPAVGLEWAARWSEDEGGPEANRRILESLDTMWQVSGTSIGQKAFISRLRPGSDQLVLAGAKGLLWTYDPSGEVLTWLHRGEQFDERDAIELEVTEQHALTRCSDGTAWEWTLEDPDKGPVELEGGAVSISCEPTSTEFAYVSGGRLLLRRFGSEENHATLETTDGVPLTSVRHLAGGVRLIALDEEGRVWSRSGDGALDLEAGAGHPWRSVIASSVADDFALIGDGGRVRVVRAGAGGPIDLLHDEEIEIASFTPSGERLLVCHERDDQANIARLWNIDSRSTAWNLGARHEGKVFEVDFDPSGRRLAIATSTRERGVRDGRPSRFRVIDATSGVENVEIGDDTEVAGLTWSRDGDILYCSLGWVRCISPEKRHLRTLHAHDTPVESAVFSPASDALLTAARTGVLEYTSWPLLERLGSFATGSARLVGFGFFLEGRGIWAAHEGGGLVEWRRGSVGWGMERHSSTDGIVAAAHDLGGKAFAVVRRSGSATLHTDAGVHEFPAADDPITCVAFDRRGYRLAIARTSRVLVWDVENRRGVEEGPVVEDGAPTSWIQWLSHDRILLERGGLLRIVDFGRQAESTRFRSAGLVVVAHEHTESHAAFRPGESTFTLYESGAEARTIQPGKAISSLDFDAEGDRLLLGFESGEALLIDRNGEPRTEYERNGASLAFARFDPTGRRLVCALTDGSLRAWPAEPLEEAYEAVPGLEHGVAEWLRDARDQWVASQAAAD